MNRTPIASPLLLVGRDATETWHGSDGEYREVGIARQFQDQMNTGKCMATCAFVVTNPFRSIPKSFRDTLSRMHKD